MFDVSLIVQTAISSFNNAALAAPTFFWSALLALPLFILVYKFGAKINQSIDWDGLKNHSLQKFGLAFCSEIILFFWLIIMRADYNVIRDEYTAVPFVLSGLLFLLTASIVQKMRMLNIKMPQFWNNLKYKKLYTLIIVLLVSLIAGVSGKPDLWIGVLQGGAVLSGAILGANKKRNFKVVSLNVLFLLTSVILILMQPELFRFGQLGSLTYVHLIALVLLCALSVAILVSRNIKPKGIVRESAYKKLRWLTRGLIFCALALFFLTESVPVFLGLMALLFFVFAFCVQHKKSLPNKFSVLLWMYLIGGFGVLISVPVITVIAILYFLEMQPETKIKQAKFLL